MAIEGSFSLDAAVKRFVARCPEIGRVKKFDELLKKGHMVSDEEVVDSVAELFINPNYTIPVLGCFGAVAEKIVERAVALLRLCNLTTGAGDTVAELGCSFDADVIYVIEHFKKCGRDLDLHELTCLAFCRALDWDHSLWRSILDYFKFAPPPFERIRKLSQLHKAVNYCLLAVRISYRFLLLEPEFFSKRWDWSCFIDFVKELINLNLVHGTEVEEAIKDIRWCGIHILSVILKMSNRAIESFGIGSEEASLCLFRWEEFCQDIVREKAYSCISSSEHSNLEVLGGGKEDSVKHIELNSLESLDLCDFQPETKSRRLVACNTKEAGNTFVMTPTIKKSFEMVLLAVSQKWPVLLFGPAGSGKTSLIRKLARDSGNTVLSIHMDDQIDGKMLIGSYVCTEQPGEFRWQPGSLVQAVLNGYWVVFEGIDKAPSDVQSVLLPLLEGARSFVAAHGEAIRVAETFRLFSTISTSKNDGLRNAEAGVSILWRKVRIELPSKHGMQTIVTAWYPNLASLSGRLVETFETINSTSMHHFMGSQHGSLPSSISPGRFSLRDLLNWCKRISGLSLMGDALTPYQCQCIYKEAVDIFAGSAMSLESRMWSKKEIAKLWAVQISEAEILQPNKPEIQVLLSELRVGRVSLQRSENVFYGQEKLVKMRGSLHVLERIAASVRYNEPVLLVGETGTGKTTLVQNLAMMLGQKLTVLNLSQQSDVADLLGGFKPTDPRSICIPIYKEFESLFSKTFSIKENDKIFAYLQKQLSNKNWKTLLNGFKKYVNIFEQKVRVEKSGSGKKRKKPLDDEERLRAWENFSVKLDTALGQVGASSGMVFSYIEGAFVTALRNGEWILLDEVNLAPPETLQRLTGVLEGDTGSLCLAERGDADHIPRHPSFRIFSCMNPATDAGKRDLPYSLRSRFTEYYVDDVLDKDDLKLFINNFMEESRSNSELEKRIIDFYETSKKSSEERLQDGANQKPQYSLRSLYRALEYTKVAKGKFGFPKAFFDGFCMFFLTLLDKPSAKIMKMMIKEKLLAGKKPQPLSFDAYLTVKRDSISNDFLENYVLTKSVKKQLENLSRAVFIKRYPVLLQGPTSSGKTSLVQYLAAMTGHEFVRINNHEHTDLQEYLGLYISDAQGKLVFHEGALVKAVRNGYWIVLDELNLAPSDVLEALNRLLDDNRELFVPELKETIRAHPNFMLFATQNPPTLYGGRKMLSRAFRNRFVEVHVDEIPDHELSTIIEKRCKIPGSRAKIMVEIMKDLQLHRQSSKVFAGKHGFITPRDLFRWANRLRTFGDTKEVMAEQGYYLLADRLRDEGERLVVQEILEKRLRVKILAENLYKETIGRDSLKLGDVIVTRSMRRLYFLVKRCHELREPVLLVGETGGGKTTVCQLLASSLGSRLHILNCHQYTETSDFIGGFYPVRDRSRLTSDFKYIVEKLKLSKAYIHFPEDMEFTSDISQASSTLEKLDAIITSYRQGKISSSTVTVQDVDTFEQMKKDLSQLHQKWQTIFTWQDGPLLQAMKAGDLFLVDEISLADDSVLERLNSVLEPERKLSLAEKGGSEMEKITAHENFFVLATMNPGGDYGKKELSPALRNRFTEIWVPSVGDVQELRAIASERILVPGKESYIVDMMLSFWEWFNQLQTGRTLTVRDILSWIEFINVTKGSLGPEFALLHGLFLILLDGLSLGTGLTRKDAEIMRENCFSFLLNELKPEDAELRRLSNMEYYGWGNFGEDAKISCGDHMQCDDIFGIDPFYIKKGYENCETEGFEFLAPTTRRNVLRVLRAMQLPKPVLLEGSPGVGKTSLIMALGKYSGHKVVRINLSEQTDLMDLLGSDLPVETDEGMKFAWSDGILLQALKEGCWVLLDELNLAPQSVLEGLNAILDHRAEVFIPELGLTFKCPTTFRVFACQNPLSQGGGRKGLPRSFLNRFTKVYTDELVEDDYLFICSSLYPSIPRQFLSKLITFNKRMHEDTMLYPKFAQNGSPWEFNLRDVIRSCEIIQGAKNTKADSFVNTLYVQRMRSAADRKEVLRLYEEVFEKKPDLNAFPRVQTNSHYLVVGNSSIKRNKYQSSKFLNGQLNILPDIRQSLEAVVQCVEHQWLTILVGPPNSGKTSLIRLVSQLTGNILHELNLSAATDISDLLGSFEQYNAFRNFRLVVSQVERIVNQYCSMQLERSKMAFVSKREDVIRNWLSFLSSMDSASMLSSPSMYQENWEVVLKSLNKLLEIVVELKSDVEETGLLFSWSRKDLDGILNAILKLQSNQQRKAFSAKFEWVSGSLLYAIENGEWVVLENANTCNPTVLDRINSLVESNGTIIVNECGVLDGSPLVLHPHPNFRIFLTVDPSNGEVSRAMRNRGVEIFMMQPYWLLDQESGYNVQEFELKGVKRFLTVSGIPVGKLVDSMAKAHLYARNAALQLNIQITYLELSRWVQLLQQLLRNGSQPSWSLITSWEHIYLCSLGEAEGCAIVNHAKVTYLSTATSLEFELSRKSSLCLPGSWPMFLKLWDYVWYAKEASVKQNFMYLEHLLTHLKSQIKSTDSEIKELLSLSSSSVVHKSGGNADFDTKLASKMILFAASWTIEQATESDYKLHLLRFGWLSSKLQAFGHLVSSFLNLLKQEFDHPIWKLIFHCHRQLSSVIQVDLNSQTLPLVSLDLVASHESARESSILLCNAINSLGLLRLSHQQWDVQNRYDYEEDSQHFKPVLDSLEALEREALNVLVQSQSYDVLSRIYSDLLDNHIAFWDALTSSQFDKLVIFWHYLMKDVSRLRDFFPGAVQNLLVVKSRNLDVVFHQQSGQPLLWIHGGHPILPASAELYHNLQRILELCDVIWPAKDLHNHDNSFIADDRLVAIVVSCTPELRFIAVEGICLSLYITSAFDEENQYIKQLEVVDQMLSSRFDYERNKLEARLHDDRFVSESSAVSCCTLSHELLCTKPGFLSWQYALPIINSTSFYLDMNVLQKLSLILLLDPSELRLAVAGVLSLLESASKFSLNFATRRPQNFVPHQKIQWTVDAWMSIDAADAKIKSYVLELWFCWHSSLWNHCPENSEIFSKAESCDTSLPYMLLQPVGTKAVIQILRSTCAIRDYYVHGLKIKVASCNFWKGSPPGRNLCAFLISVARSLFQQILQVHERTFEADAFAAIKSILFSSQKIENEIQKLSSLLMSSTDRQWKSSFQLFIEPVLKVLYYDYSSKDFDMEVGNALLCIGGLRFSLLVGDDNFDPAMKYFFKYLQLQEKISSLKLEMKVRQECDYWAGSFSSRTVDQKRVEELEKLEADCKRIQRKMVFRCSPLKFHALKKECHDFHKRLILLMNMVNNIHDLELQQVLVQTSNWQETSTSFINLLSHEYKEYADITQPVQVAVYEMKLGLSLVLAGVMQKDYLSKIEHDDLNEVVESIYSLMKFPRGIFSEGTSCHETQMTSFSSELNLLEKLLSFSSDISTEKMVHLQRKAELYCTILVRVAHYVAIARRIDLASFKILNKILEEIAGMWMQMKVQVKSREGRDAQQYKFRPRAFTISSVVDVDLSTLGRLFANDSFSEWQLFTEEESLEKTDASEEYEGLEEEWEHMQGPIMNVIHIHNQFFGSIDLVQNAGTFDVTDSERLNSFIEAYVLGSGIIKGFGGSFVSSLDAELMPEHLLRLSLEHERKFVQRCTSSKKYNFYKDSNAPAMARMVKLLNSLQHQICAFLKEWDDHPGLQKMIDVIEMLLSIPVDTAIAKVLSGLQFLLNKARVLQENGSRFSLTETVEPIISLVCSWQKLEFECWPALLDEVQDGYEMNAAKLWFPLSSVLQRNLSSDVATHEQSTKESLEEFILTSSVGEFRKRLQLLFAFHGQITAGRCLQVEAYSSSLQERNRDILYNVFGYYVQFLPRVLEHVQTNRRNIESELKKLLKLCSWERPDACLLAETSKRTRHKLKKLIQKYSDILQEPIMLILKQEAERFQSWEGLMLLTDTSKNDKGISTSISDQSLFGERSLWYADWWRKVTSCLQNTNLDVDSAIFLNEDVGSLKSASQPHCEGWNAIYQTLDETSKQIMYCRDTWKDITKSGQKKRALYDLLKQLEQIGLHKHKFENLEVSNSSKWFLQPTYDAQHLLLRGDKLLNGVSDHASKTEFGCSLGDDIEWRTANEFYFKSAAAVQLLQQTCLKRHEDITNEQVTRSVSFLNHLVVIQQTQRSTLYSSIKHLKCLQESVSALGNAFSRCSDSSKGTKSECSISPNHHVIFKWIWKQKGLLDYLYNMLIEESLLLRTVESTHSMSCDNVKAEVTDILSFIDGLSVPVQNSKETLDKLIVRHVGVMQTLSQEFLGSYVLHRVGALAGCPVHPYVVSKEMEQVVYSNFLVIEELEKRLLDFRSKNSGGYSTVVNTLFGRLAEALKKGKLMAEELYSTLSVRSELTNACNDSNYSIEKESELEAEFNGAVRKMFKLVLDSLRKLLPLSNGCTLSEDSFQNITKWEDLFNTSVTSLNMEELCDSLVIAIYLAEKLVHRSGHENQQISSQIGACFEHLHALLNLILSLTDALIKDLLTIQIKVSVTTYELASVLVSLISKGFGISAKDQADDEGHDIPQDAAGTGMGEGSGVKDVSDQITDEDQLLGASEKGGEEPDGSNEIQKNKDKGIEMEEDFAADTFSVSEDEESEDDKNEDGEDEQLDSAMGEAGADSEAVDEKVWDKGEDEPPNETEKFDSGPSVVDKDTSSRELRAKDDSAAGADDENGELEPDNPEKQNDESGMQDDFGDGEDTKDDLTMDKQDAFTEPTGLQPDEDMNQSLDEDGDAGDGMSEDEAVPEDGDESALDMNTEENNEEPPDDEIMDHADDGKVGETSEKDEMSKEREDDPNMNSTERREDASGLGISDLLNNHMTNAESATQPNGDSQMSNSQRAASKADMYNSSEACADVVPLRNMPFGNGSENDIMVSDLSNSGKLSDDKQNAQLPQEETSFVPKLQPNPYRNVGNALEEWKERVKVSVDLQTEADAAEEVKDEDATEYGFASQIEKGGAQTLGPATAEQVDANVDGNKPDEDNVAPQVEDVDEMEIEKQDSDEMLPKSSALMFNKAHEQRKTLDIKSSPVREASPEVYGHDSEPQNMSDSLVSVGKSSVSEDLHKFSDLSVEDNDLGKAANLEETSLDLKTNAASLWRRYELATNRLSQELAEQLRLVMEPTIASKLQGDYKTGKRINMKKVIPYIASHYRKDKIWLRRTRPNKRDYQVVIAVDDSRSMSENRCGSVAVEALVTVCRAMSQLELGNLAVASFGKQGNIKLLHEFGQPFTGDAGVKIISNLAFRQENTIADEPVVDLIKYLQNMLDTAVNNARLPSGQNPLQQLVLIIADGRFHEKERLRRCVRDFLSQKRMVAFLLLDSPQESIMDQMEASFVGQGENRVLKFTKYLDSFPFPFYIVLRNVEALPRTLADLLRQWFELMQYSRD